MRKKLLKNRGVNKRGGRERVEGEKGEERKEDERGTEQEAGQMTRRGEEKDETRGEGRVGGEQDFVSGCP